MTYNATDPTHTHNMRTIQTPTRMDTYSRNWVRFANTVTVALDRNSDAFLKDISLSGIKFGFVSQKPPNARGGTRNILAPPARQNL
jgi:hypothetical protein